MDNFFGSIADFFRWMMSLPACTKNAKKLAEELNQANRELQEIKMRVLENDPEIRSYSEFETLRKMDFYLIAKKYFHDDKVFVTRKILLGEDFKVINEEKLYELENLLKRFFEEETK